MDDVLYYNDLFDLYGDLLTEKQQLYFKDYYFNNLSYSEMAENYNVSRNAIFKQIHLTIDKLNEYESKLKLLQKKKKLEDIINNSNDLNLNKKLEDIILM